MYADGSRDARDTKELAIQQRFFPLNQIAFDGKLEKFKIKLNVTEQSPDGRGGIKYAHGVSELQMFINKRPENGTCWIKIRGVGTASDPEEVTWTPTKTGRALLDEFWILCQNWVDPDDHTVNKFVFKSKYKIYHYHECHVNNIIIIIIIIFIIIIIIIIYCQNVIADSSLKIV